MEAHSYPYKKYNANILMRFFYQIDSVYSRNVHKYIDLVTAITDVKEDIWGCKTIRIENGVNLLDNELRNSRCTEHDELRLVCVANETISHGIDRLLYGLKNYYKVNQDKEVLVWMIGEYSKKTKDLVNKLKLEKYILFVGKKYGNELKKYYSEADLGIGVLAGYRQNYHQGICLKTKEYFAVGLPFVTSAEEKAEINGFPYVYVAPEDDGPIIIDEIIKFYDNLGNKMEIAKEMHDFAVENYSWEREIKKIFYSLNEGKKRNEERAIRKNSK